MKKTKSRKPAKRQDWPLVVYMWAVGLALLSYIVARMALNGWPHPYHWLAGLLGGAVGILLGWLWYRWRGDVI